MSWMPLLVWWATDVCMNGNCFSSQLPSIDLRTDALYTFRGYNPHPLSPFHSYHIHFHPTPSWSALSTPRHHPVGIAPQNILSYLRIQSKLKWNWPIRFKSLGGGIQDGKGSEGQVWMPSVWGHCKDWLPLWGSHLLQMEKILQVKTSF